MVSTGIESGTNCLLRGFEMVHVGVAVSVEMTSWTGFLEILLSENFPFPRPRGQCPPEQLRIC